jgi:hypothetical protein
MADPDQCKDLSVGGAAQTTIVFAFDLVDKEIPKVPARILKSLESKEVQDAIKATLTKFAQSRAQSTTTVVSDKEAKELAEALAKGVGEKAGDEILEQIKKSPEYKKLAASLKDFEAAAKCSPMGVWVDKNQTTLYIVGAALLLGGSAALYITKTGGAAVDLPVGLLKGKSLNIVKVGGFSLKGQLLEFKPETRTIGAGLTLAQDLDQVKLTFKLGVIASGTEVKQVNAQAIVKADDFTITVSGAADTEKKKINLGIGLGIPGSGPLGPVNLTIGAVVTDGKVTGGQFDATMKTKYGDIGVKGQVDEKSYGGMATYSIPF